MLEKESDMVEKDGEIRIETLKQGLSSKRALYYKMNPELKSTVLYKNDSLKEFQQIEVFRFGLSSLNLKVETGWWSTVQRDNHVCSCNIGGVQDE